MITSAYFKMPRMLWVYSPPLVLRKSTEFKARAWEMLLFIAARIVSAKSTKTVFVETKTDMYAILVHHRQYLLK